jgi:hypothetical protein
MGIKARTAKAATTDKTDTTNQKTGQKATAKKATAKKATGQKAAGKKKTSARAKAGAPKARAPKAAARKKAPGRAAGSRARAARKTVDDYVSGLEGWRQEAITALRQVVREAAPEAEEAIKWGQPVYSQNGMVCYLRALNNHVNLGFARGTELEAPEGLLVGEGENMAHISFSSREDINPEVIAPLIRRAVELNQTLGDPTQKKKRRTKKKVA